MHWGQPTSGGHRDFQKSPTYVCGINTSATSELFTSQCLDRHSFDRLRYMYRMPSKMLLFPTIAATVISGCYESTRIEVSSIDTSAAETDTSLVTDTEEIHLDTGSDTAPPAQGPMTFRIRNGRSFVAYFDLTYRKWMDLKRADPPPENEIYLDWPYCVERCVDVPTNDDPLCHRPCIAISQVYVLYPGDEVDVPWDGRVRTFDPDRLPYCSCCIEADPVPGRYTVQLSVYNKPYCTEPCPSPPRSGMAQNLSVGIGGPSIIAKFPFSIPRSEPVFLLEF